MQKQIFKISGMTCPACAGHIQAYLQARPGVAEATVTFRKNNVELTYDESVVKLDELQAGLAEMNYFLGGEGRRLQVKQYFVPLLTITGFLLLLNYFNLSDVANAFPAVGNATPYLMLFVIGLMTSLHCVAMCGGINLSQCLPVNRPGEPAKVWRRALLYNGGRLTAYTLVGALVGGLGSMVSIPGAGRGAVQIAAGIFMMLMALNMLQLFPGLKRCLPGLPPKLAAKFMLLKQKAHAPYIIGLLNGCMPCGPLQAMQLYALSLAHPFKGALAMFLFCAGTIPLMFGLGVCSTLLNRRAAGRLTVFGGTLVLILGISMLNNGLSLSGVHLQFFGQPRLTAVLQNGLQVVEMPLAHGSYEPLAVAAGVPVQWRIMADPEALNGCNNQIIIPEWGLKVDLQPGENLIEFIPAKPGTFVYTCWMGMIKSSIKVK